jgi:hypothetical protein
VIQDFSHRLQPFQIRRPVKYFVANGQARSTGASRQAEPSLEAGENRLQCQGAWTAVSQVHIENVDRKGGYLTSDRLRNPSCRRTEMPPIRWRTGQRQERPALWLSGIIGSTIES